MSNAENVLEIIQNSLGATTFGIAYSLDLDVYHVGVILGLLIEEGLVHFKIRRTMGGNKITFHPIASYEDIDAVLGTGKDAA